MKSALLLFISTLIFAAPPVRASENRILYPGPESWTEFETQMHLREHEDEIAGLSYMIGGTIATVGGVAGVQASQDVFSRSIFAISETLGVAAIGYGADLYWNGNDLSSFYRAVRDSSLSSAQKTELLQKYLINERAEYDHARWIHIATYSLLAAINFYSASKEENRDIRGALQFLGGLDLALAFSYTW